MSRNFAEEMAAAWLHDRMTEELRLRCDRFAVDYRVADKPAVVLQVMPVVATTIVDVRSEPTQKALRRQGVQPRFAWWQQFASSSGVKPVFDGIAANATRGADGWATELHSDGHLIAGLWEFPRNGDQGSAVQAFFKHAFADFASLTEGVYQAANVQGRLVATCTLLNAAKLHLMAGDGWGEVSPAPRRERLEWPVAEIGSVDEMTAACEAMKARFCSAYGAFELTE